MWRINEIDVLPKLVDCPDGLYPESDADGVKIFENTHFVTREEAMKNIEENLLARVVFWGRTVTRREKELEETRKDAADAAAALAKFLDAKDGE